MKKIIFLLLGVCSIQLGTIAQNVGIGTNNPLFKLDVRNGSINTDSVYRIRDTPIISASGFNLKVGFLAGVVNTGLANSFFGSWSGFRNTSGIENCFLGAAAGFNNTTGDVNTFIGANSGTNNSTGSENTFVGQLAGWFNTTGIDNTCIGAAANLTLGNLTNATAIGARSIVSSSNSLILGGIEGINGAPATPKVGIGISAPQAQLHIASNSDASSPHLLLEEVEDDFIRIRFKTLTDPLRQWEQSAIILPLSANSAMGFIFNGNPVLALQGNGNALLTGTLTQTSDSRLKTNILPINNALSRVTQLNGYNYQWKDQYKDQSLQTGVLAQEVQKIFPELVNTDDKGMLSVNYIGLVPVVITAVKEQQQQIDLLKKENEEMKQLTSQQQQQMQELQKRIAIIEKALK